ncbi:MAG: ABC transporter ATP-binding protein [Desulfarculaceae bacterium]|nr:ABC transporter ATP-binding protein [Desulfarculaceae bacterium]MCF8047276.1 ABC transporter ATP-binding protein [Desulfarculaceae bacterium]MCF8097421.1 ABC transporter ATP-binding protein [Desulfarculaceae bacterium]MCF8123305.1 ABC transporter ATP-binding protein [Desulfarculaceae bacterium]
MSNNGGKNKQNQDKGELILEDVTRVFRLPGMPSCNALKKCSFTVPRGSLTVLVGPSGCGKSTLANIAAGYDHADSGKVLIDGKPVTGPGRDRIMVFQETALWPWMTVMKNATFGPTMLGGMNKSEAEQRAIALLDKVGLKDFRDKYPAQLSGGMQRRAELCRALVMDPKVMILDEPFRGLDVMTRELMQEYLLTLYRETGLTMLFITSEIEEALFLGDRILVMTNLPGTIKTTVEVDLPRPRDFKVLSTERYRQIKSEVMESLYEEGAKIFAKLDGAGDLMGSCRSGA